ncbi:MAG: TetR/AcrR family transcriptional regulator [Deltaproteobacteria bacterium]|nr:TetR/AcrR family transcriptional regulator [Deltaproteobacteria bacterium]
MVIGAERKRIRPKAKRAGAFHHGDLQEALIQGARQAVESVGHGALSLRPIAARLGVSQPAMYRHFADKGALLAEVARRADSELEQAMAAGMHDQSDPFLAMRAGGRAYVGWAYAHPNLFRLMSSRIPAEHRSGPRPALPREHYFQGLGGIVPIDDPLLADAFRVSWAMVHGLANLVIEHVFQLVDTDHERLAVADQVIDCYVEMLRAKWPRS